MVIDEPRLPGVLMPEAYKMLTASQGGGPDNARRLGLRPDRYSHPQPRGNSQCATPGLELSSTAAAAIQISVAVQIPAESLTC